jgi:hypothetical protein
LAAKIAREKPTATIARARMPYHASTRPTRLMSAPVMVRRMTPISKARMPASRKISR